MFPQPSTDFGGIEAIPIGSDTNLCPGGVGWGEERVCVSAIFADCFRPRTFSSSGAVSYGAH